MINEGKVEEAVEVFLKNNYWRGYYEGAPSDKCKRYIALEFYWSYDENATDYKEEGDAMLQELTLTDWEYLYKYSGNNPWRTQCKKRIVELKGESV